MRMRLCLFKVKESFLRFFLSLFPLPRSNTETIIPRSPEEVKRHKTSHRGKKKKKGNRNLEKILRKSAIGSIKKRVRFFLASVVLFGLLLNGDSHLGVFGRTVQGTPTSRSSAHSLPVSLSVRGEGSLLLRAKILRILIMYFKRILSFL